MSLTRGQLISQGLDLAGRPDLTSQARFWLNLFLEEKYMNEDFGWLVKRATGIVIANGSSVPSDYRSARAAIVVQTSSGVNVAEIQVTDNMADYENRLTSYGNQSGTAKYAYVDRNNAQFLFLPTPLSGYTMTLDYYFLPALPDPTDPAHDTDVPTWKLPQKILMDHIKSMGMEYNDDQRQTQAAGDVEKDVTAAKFNNNDKRAGSSRFALGKRFRNRFR